MPQYGSDSTNYYGFYGSTGEGVGKHTNSRVDRFTATRWNNLELILNESRVDHEQAKTDIIDATNSIVAHDSTIAELKSALSTVETSVSSLSTTKATKAGTFVDQYAVYNEGGQLATTSTTKTQIDYLSDVTSQLGEKIIELETYANLPPARVLPSWAIRSPSGSSGDYYFAGFYRHSSTASNFSSIVGFGNSYNSYAAHFFVVLGEATVDQLTISVTGTAINDNGDRTEGMVDTIVIPNSTAVDSYFETSVKWIGQVNINVTGGTAKSCNYGFCKYWNNNNTDFTTEGCEITGLAGANDTGVDFQLIHHTATGWTYNASAPADPPVLASMDTDHGVESRLINGEQFAWKRSNLNTFVEGSGSEGILFKITTSTNNAIDIGTCSVVILPSS